MAVDQQVTSYSMTDAKASPLSSKGRTASDDSEAATPDAGHSFSAADAPISSAIQEPRSIDFVFGLGRGYRYEGNQIFKEIVKNCRVSYEFATSCERIKIKYRIVDHLLSLPGKPRFLTLTKLFAWKELTYEESVQKTSAAFSNLRYNKINYYQIREASGGAESTLASAPPCSKGEASSSDSGVASAAAPKRMTQLHTDTNASDLEKPRSIDIVCGRGWGMAPGNVGFRHLVESYFWTYEGASKHDRMKINRAIVELIKEQPGAPRFLTENRTTRVWEELCFKKSVEKIAQTFRNFRPRSKPVSKAMTSTSGRLLLR
jgi:hypothetical protein